MPKPNKPGRKLAWKAIKTVGKRAAGGVLEPALQLIRTAADRAAATGSEAAEKTAHKRLPIQKQVDIGVPIRIAWEEWLEFESIPEGVHTITNIERDGDQLFGTVSGPLNSEWAADIIDERSEQSFAWRSYEGTDCAGLITFHSLSERLTRLELNLDVVPTGVGETLQLATHLANHRAETDLRRFKAKLELINPDLYNEIAPPPEPEKEAKASAEEDEQPQGQSDEPDGEVEQDEAGPDEEEIPEEELEEEEAAA